MSAPALRARAGDAWRTWAALWATPASTLGWLRIVYGAALLLLWPPLDSRPLAELPGDLWYAPLGPFLLMSGYPPLLVLTGLEVASRACLVLLAFGAGTRVASLGFAISATFLAGVRYSTGKIDHDILILGVAPALMAFSSWGDRWSVDGLIAAWRGRPRVDSGSAGPLSILALCTGVEFFTSGVVKALTGWLDPAGSAVRAWVFQYVFALNPNEVSVRAVGVSLPAAWEALDIATVVFEVGFLVAIVSRQWTRLYVAAACAFHVGILMLMGIDFAKLSIVYLLLIARSGRDAAKLKPTRPSRLRLGLWASAAIVGALAIPAFWLAGGSLELLRSLESLRLQAPFSPALAVLIALGVYAVWRWRRGAEARIGIFARGSGPVVSLPLATLGIVLTLFVSEPFPAVIGPLFWGDRSHGASASILVPRIEVRVAGDEMRVLGASELYALREPYASNLLAVQFPANSTGAALDRLEHQGHAFLPFDGGADRGVVGVEACRRFEHTVGIGEVAVEWIEVRYVATSTVSSETIASYEFSTGGSCASEQHAVLRLISELPASREP